jgi:uncharacterized membrane protein HdeD (DUF308 family)
LTGRHNAAYPDAKAERRCEMAGFLSSFYQRSWWSLMIRGIVAVVFGILALSWPVKTLDFLVTLFGIFVLVVGLVATIGAIMHRKESENWWLILIPGIAGIVIGIITIAVPEVTQAIIIYLIAIWALVSGIGQIYSAIKLRKDVQGEWIPIIVGVVSVVLAIILFSRPLAAAAAVMWLVGLFVLALGILWIIMAFRVRKWSQSPGGGTPVPPSD